MSETSEDKKRQEIKELLEEKAKPLTKRMSLIYDGRQFSIRLPIEFSKILNLAPRSKQKFEFRLSLPSPLDEETKPKLTGVLLDE